MRDFQEAERHTSALRAFLPSFLRDNPFRRFGAHGVGIGRKIVAGSMTDQVALRVYTACKRPIVEVPVARRVPTRLRIADVATGEEIDVATDVIETPFGGLHMPDPGDRFRPVPGGVSCAAPSFFGTGTIGGWVWDRTDDSIVMLSNQHVFGFTPNVEIIQPGGADGGQPGVDRIGRVKRSIQLVPLTEPITPADCNLVDAAIGGADSSDLFDLTVLEIGPAVYTVEDAVIDMAVEKSGQTTGHTRGIATDVDYATYFAFPDVGDAVMCDLIRIEPENPAQLWGSNGDSGSLVFRQEDPSVSVIKPAVGLYFAGGGTPPHNWGAACKIGNVFQALDLDVLCSGGFAAFLDALFADGQDDQAAVVAGLFDPRSRGARAGSRFHAGLARDVEARLRGSRRGRAVVDFVDRQRAELMSLLVGDGDVRRSTVDALRPLLRGAVTTDHVLNRELERRDIDRVERLADVVEKRASEKLRKAIAPLRALLPLGKGKSLAALLGLEAGQEPHRPVKSRKKKPK